MTNILDKQPARNVRIVVAMATNGTIGKNNTLPWRLRSDLQRFKKTTMGHALIMGRKTYESIGKPLPGRRTIVLSRQPELEIPGCEVANSLADAVDLLDDNCIPFVVGGAEIYRMAMPYTDHLYVTLVDAHVDGDATMERWNESEWSCLEQESLAADETNQYATTFRHLVRNRSNANGGN